MAVAAAFLERELEARGPEPFFAAGVTFGAFDVALALEDDAVVSDAVMHMPPGFHATFVVVLRWSLVEASLAVPMASLVASMWCCFLYGGLAFVLGGGRRGGVAAVLFESLGRIRQPYEACSCQPGFAGRFLLEGIEAGNGCGRGGRGRGGRVVPRSDK